MCYISSRFCSDAESRYAPIEGEALAVAWALEKAKYFLMGCQDLYVGVDHKPLLGIYAEGKALTDIGNPRLRNLAEKASRYRFTTFHVKGKDNNLPDSMSRFPVGPGSHMELNAVERIVANGVAPDAWMGLVSWLHREEPQEQDKVNATCMEEEVLMAASVAFDDLYKVEEETHEGSVGAIQPRVLTWSMLRAEAAMDEQYQEMVKYIGQGSSGFHWNPEWPTSLAWMKRQPREMFSVVDEVVAFLVIGQLSLQV